jgi:hypothetical protein
MRVTSLNFLKPTFNLYRLWSVKNAFITVNSKSADFVAACSICSTINVKKQRVFSTTAYLNNSFQFDALNRPISAVRRFTNTKHAFAVKTPSVDRSLFVYSCCMLRATRNLSDCAM